IPSKERKIPPPPRQAEKRVRERLRLHLLLAETNRALILECRQHRKSLTADAAAQTGPVPERQHSSVQTDLPLLTTPTPQSGPNIPESSFDLIDIQSWLTTDPDLWDIRLYHRATPTPATANSTTQLQVISRKIAAKQSAQTAQRRSIGISPRKRRPPTGKLSPTKRRPTAPRLPGQRRKPRVISNEMLRVPLPLPLGKSPLVKEKTPPEPMASAAVDLTTSD
ncbi:hypothetical protein TSAR_014343, partial [Trichomalopsis sarcophagae]